MTDIETRKLKNEIEFLRAELNTARGQIGKCIGATRELYWALYGDTAAGHRDTLTLAAVHDLRMNLHMLTIDENPRWREVDGGAKEFLVTMLDQART